MSTTLVRRTDTVLAHGPGEARPHLASVSLELVKVLALLTGGIMLLAI